MPGAKPSENERIFDNKSKINSKDKQYSPFIGLHDHLVVCKPVNDIHVFNFITQQILWFVSA